MHCETLFYIETYINKNCKLLKINITISILVDVEIILKIKKIVKNANNNNIRI